MNKVQWELMRPHEIEAAMAGCPTAFVPLGTLEWHGLQNALGLDALKAHALCVRAAVRSERSDRRKSSTSASA